MRTDVEFDAYGRSMDVYGRFEYMCQDVSIDV